MDSVDYDLLMELLVEAFGPAFVQTSALIVGFVMVLTMLLVLAKFLRSDMD